MIFYYYTLGRAMGELGLAWGGAWGPPQAHMVPSRLIFVRQKYDISRKSLISFKHGKFYVNYL